MRAGSSGDAAAASQRLSPTLVGNTLLAGLAAVLFGASTGVSSSALQNLLDLGALYGTRKLGPMGHGVIVASAWSGAILGSLMAMGAPTPRLALVASALLHSVGGLVIVAAPVLPALVVGRLLCGLGNGLITVALNTYTAEIAPPPVRGGAVALQETTFLVGALGGALAGRTWLRIRGGWRWSWGMSLPLGVLAYMVLRGMPDTPRSVFRSLLAEQGPAAQLVGDSGGTGGGRPDQAAALVVARAEATRALCSLRGLEAPDGPLQAELDEIEEAWRGGAAASDLSFMEIAGSRERRQLLLACSVAMAGPALCGHVAFEGYGTQIFHMLGYGTRTSADLMVGLYAVRLVTTLPDFLWLDTFGRRALMAAGLVGVGSSYSAASAAYLAGSPAAAAGAVLLSAGLYQAAVSPLAWIAPTEVLPAGMRLKGGGLSAMVYAASVQLVLQLHPLLAQHGVLVFMTTYSGMTTVAFLLNRALLPETVGRSLEDIEREALSGGLWRRSSMREARELLGLADEEDRDAGAEGAAGAPAVVSSSSSPEAAASAAEPAGPASEPLPRGASNDGANDGRA